MTPAVPLAALTPWEALVLGVVEGLTEFLPVSSTGHLLLAERLLGLAPGPGLHAFTVAVQVGAILAVLGLYRARAAQCLRGLAGRDAEGARLSRSLVVAFAPAAVAGVVAHDRIERHLFGLWPTVAAWAVGGVALLALGPWLARRRERDAGGALESLTLTQAFGVGLFQLLALWPGTSRSLATLVGGLVVGLRLAAAVEFSFLLGVLTLAAAAGWAVVRHGGELASDVGATALVLGLLAAAATAVIAVRFLVGWVRTHSLAVFGWYRLGLAAVVAALLLV